MSSYVRDANGNPIGVEQLQPAADAIIPYGQVMLLGSKKINTVGNPTRGSAGYINSTDSLDLAALPSDLTSNLISAKDGSMLVLWGVQTSNGGSVVITPLAFDDEDPANYICILSALTLSQSQTFQDSNGDYQLSVAFCEIGPFLNIGLHITTINVSGNTVKIWGLII